MNIIARTLWIRLTLLLAAALVGFVASSGGQLSGETHWAFIPPSMSAPPQVSGGEQPANPIDAFVVARLQTQGIPPLGLATRPELLRRVTYDLTGLPPTPAELRAFLADDSASAWEKVVDRLLASPAYGERWAQHWLDLAHYADSNGFELDADRPDAWRYRDWVIHALNEDMPYDRFLTLQISGDESAPGDREALIASGFARSGPREVVGGNIDPEVRRQNELTEAVNTVGSVFLGLTVGCARCHDHKFDPLPSRDYYRLEAFFGGTQLKDLPIHSAAEKEAYDRALKEIREQIKPLEEAKKKIEAPYRQRLQKQKEDALTAAEREIRAKPEKDRTPEEQRLFEGIGVALKVTWEEIAEAVARNPEDHQQREALKREIYELERREPRPPPEAMAMAEDNCERPEAWLLARGNIKNKREKVEPAPPEVLLAQMGSHAFKGPAEPTDKTHSGWRLALAHWMTATNNPLTARVIVNRLWQHHFGRGLVATSSDFGTRGERPLDQPLLDFLATELIRGGWRLKPLHRLILTSQAYQRSSAATKGRDRWSEAPAELSNHEPRASSTSAVPITSSTKAVHERSSAELSNLGPRSPSTSATTPIPADPENRYFWRMNRKRMDAEALRDSILAVSGQLNRKRGGPGVLIHLEPEVESLIFTEQEVVDLWPVNESAAERCRRSIYVYRKRNVHYPMFDAFDAPDALTPCPVRAVSTHAPQALVLLNSRFAQESAEAFAHDLLRIADPAERVNEAFLRCYAREPSSAELKSALAFTCGGRGSEVDRWSDFTLALINSNEFAYVP